jgi:Pyruvate/2-oxoacid:ferredoxin oxidoreductase gamma subunit
MLYHNPFLFSILFSIKFIFSAYHNNYFNMNLKAAAAAAEFIKSIHTHFSKYL